MRIDKIERYVKQGGRWTKYSETQAKETDIEQLHFYADLDKIRLVMEIVRENDKPKYRIVGWYFPDGVDTHEYIKAWEQGYHDGYGDGKRRGYCEGCEVGGIKIEY